MNRSDVSVFLFTSDAFSARQPLDTKPVGEDLAKYIGARLVTDGWQVASLVEATEGWELDVRIQSVRFLLFVHWVPIGTPPSDQWAIQVRRPTSFRNLIGLQSASKNVSACVQALSHAFAGQREIQNGRWISKDEFRTIY